MSESIGLGTTEKRPYEKPELVTRERLYRIAAGGTGGGIDGGGGGVGIISPAAVGAGDPLDLIDPEEDLL